MTSAAASHTCPVCASGDTERFLSFPSVPVHCNVLCTTPEQALSVPKAAIELAQCRSCSHVFNAAFDPAHVEYGGQYENSLFYSPTFRRYAEDCARQLVERYNLRNKTVLEIGAGDGQFLGLLCEYGDNRGIAFDPSAATEHAASHPRITVIRDYFDERYAGYQGDLICCRQVLEHIWDPVPFLRTIRRSLGAHSRSNIFFEVPNAASMFAEGRIWDVIYEHYSYFTPQSLTRVMERAGFTVQRVEATFGEQYLCIECVPGEESAMADAPAQAASNETASSRDKIAYWQQRIEALRETGRQAVVWGAGSKGITFLNMLQAGPVVDRVIDVNPRKHGMYVAGTAHRIGAPAELRDDPPSLVLAANALYHTEIEQMLAGMGVASEVACL